jgi:hypothetical protein
MRDRSRMPRKLEDAMKRWSLYSAALVVTIALAAASLRADVKTTEHSTFHFEGLVGAFINRMAGGDAGLTYQIAVKGNRMSRITGNTGQIIDLGEEKVYTLDMKKKEYKVQTFAELRAELEKARADAEKRQQDVSKEDKEQAQQASEQIDFDVKVEPTNEHKTIAGHDARKTILTLTMREKGKTLEDGGGMVITDTMWMAPRVAALDEVRDFYLKYFQAVYGQAFAGMDLQQMNAVSALLQGLGPSMQRMSSELKKLQGTPLASEMVVESVKSAEQMKAASSNGGGGGLGGMLARRMMRRQTEQRTKALTTTNETMSIAASATADDVAIPAGFKQKK